MKRKPKFKIDAIPVYRVYDPCGDRPTVALYRKGRFFGWNEIGRFYSRAKAIVHMREIEMLPDVF